MFGRFLLLVMIKLMLTNCFVATPLQNLGDVWQEDDNRQQHVRLKVKRNYLQH